jgi:hypothetical protein
VVTEVTILGLTLQGHGADTRSNLAEISNKLKKQVNHWARFNLSLPGRVSIAKTMLYSQINYLGCFLNIPDEFINNYSATINGFVSGKLKIAKNRFTKTVSDGGLGLFDLIAFLDAQRISWIKHAKKLDDWWKISMYYKCYDGIYNIRKRFFDPQREPCQFAIVSSYEKFITQFTRTGYNFKNVYLFENKALNLGLRDNRIVDAGIFSLAFFTEYGTRLRKLTTANLLHEDGSLKSRQQFIQSTEIPILMQCYQLLRGVLETAVVRFNNNKPNVGNIVDIASFLNRSRKGSKRHRTILSPVCPANIPHNIVKFSDNVEIMLGVDDSKKVNAFWNLNYLSNSTRTFIFKLYNNILGYNVAVSHFIRNHSRHCTFCDITGNQDIIDETPIHLFFQCAAAEILVNEIFKWVTNDLTFEISRKEYFAFFDRIELSNQKNSILTIVAKLVLKFI